MNDFDPKNCQIFVESIFILMAAKKYTSNFSDSPFGSNYCTSSKASPIALFKQPYFQCIFEIFQTVGKFFRTFIQFIFKYSENYNYILLSMKSQINHPYKYLLFDTLF